MFHTYATWADVLTDATAGRALYYQGPMDYRPSLIYYKPVKGNRIRVIPPSSAADPFWADAKHLDRFRSKEN